MLAPGGQFLAALVARERTDVGIRFRFRAQPGVEEWVRDIAAEEGEIRWDAAVP